MRASPAGNGIRSYDRLVVEDCGVAGDDPALGVFGDLEILIRAGVFYLAIGTIVDDEAELACRAARGGTDGDVEVDAETICTALRDLAGAPGIIRGRSVPGVDAPTRIVAIGAIVVDANIAGGWLSEDGKGGAKQQRENKQLPADSKKNSARHSVAGIYRRERECRQLRTPSAIWHR